MGGTTPIPRKLRALSPRMRPGTARASHGGGSQTSARSRCWTRYASGSTRYCRRWGRRTTPKQRITGTLVHQQLLREGHQVGSTTVRAYLAEQRRARQEVYLPLVWRAGDGAQVDFFEVTVEVAGERLKAWLFVLRLMYSGRDFGWLYERCNQVAFSGRPRARLQARLSVAYLTTP